MEEHQERHLPLSYTQAVSVRVEASSLQEDTGCHPPYVQLVFQQPGPFLDQLTTDRL